MFKDLRLNVMQWSKDQLKKKYEAFHNSEDQ